MDMAQGGEDAIELVVEGRARDIGGFEVRRILPFAKRRMVGPFIFLDEMGPAELPAGQGIDVRPHPHIGLSTLTYLFAGEIMHRDSLGVVQAIRPGAVNWMTAGRGIVHSERSGDDARAAVRPLHGMQSWIALPLEHEECNPAFSHHAAGDLPTIEAEGVAMRLLSPSCSTCMPSCRPAPASPSRRSMPSARSTWSRARLPSAGGTSRRAAWSY